MPRYSNRKGNVPSASVAARYLEESATELMLLNKEFDQGNTLVYRTLSVVCSRIFEELSVVDPHSQLKLLSLGDVNSDALASDYINYIVVCKTGLPDKQLISFRPHPATTKYLSPNEIEDDLFIDSKMWRSAKIFSSSGLKKDAISRQDLFRFIRNFSGAHFVRQSSEFDRKMVPKVPSLNLAGAINTNEPSKENILYNSPFPSLLRTFSEEIRISLQSKMAQLLIDKKRKEEPDISSLNHHAIEYHVELLPWNPTLERLGTGDISVKVCDKVVFEKRSGLIVGSTPDDRAGDKNKRSK